jgi:hypothetical protein
MAAASTPSTPETARAGSEMPPGKAATTVADMAVAMAPVTAVAMAEGAVVAAGIEWLWSHRYRNPCFFNVLIFSFFLLNQCPINRKKKFSCIVFLLICIPISILISLDAL